MHRAVTAEPRGCTAAAGCTYQRAGGGQFYTCAAHAHRHACGRERCDSCFIGDDAQLTCARTGRWLGAAVALSPFAAVVHGAAAGGARALIDRRSAAAAAATPPTPPPPRDPFRPNVRARQARRAEALVRTLLFGPRRAALVSLRSARAVQEARTATRRHCRERARAGLAPDVDALRALCVAATQAHACAPAPAPDARREEELVSCVLRAWAGIADAPYTRANFTHIQFDDVALAVLFLRGRGGVAFGGGAPAHLRACAYLSGALPALADLGRLGINVKGFTRGRNHLFKAWRSRAPTPPPTPPPTPTR
jgi:hypothetical protein